MQSDSNRISKASHAPWLAVTLLFIPLAEYIFLRYFVRVTLGVRLGFKACTDYDLLPPILVAAVGIISIFNRDKKISVAPQKSTLVIHFFLLGLFLAFTVVYQSLLSYSRPLFMILWFSSAFAVLFTGAFLFLPFPYFLKHPQRLLAIPAALLATSGFISRTVFDSLWEPLARMTGLVCYQFLRVFLPMEYAVGENTRALRISEYTLLSSSPFSITIGRGCGGMEGIFFFLFVLGLVYMARRDKLSFSRWAFWAALGIAFMFSLNVFRLCTFFSISRLAVVYLGNTSGVHATRVFFHDILGWAFYGVGLSFFFRAMFRREGTRFTEVSPEALAQT